MRAKILPFQPFCGTFVIFNGSRIKFRRNWMLMKCGLIRILQRVGLWICFNLSNVLRNRPEDDFCGLFLWFSGQEIGLLGRSVGGLLQSSWSTHLLLLNSGRGRIRILEVGCSESVWSFKNEQDARCYANAGNFPKFLRGEWARGGSGVAAILSCASHNIALCP